MTVLADGLAQERPAQGGRHGRVALEPRQLVAPPRRLLGLAPRAVDAVVVERPQRGHGLHRPVRARQRRGVAAAAAARGDGQQRHRRECRRDPSRSIHLVPMIGASHMDPQRPKVKFATFARVHHDTADSVRRMRLRLIAALLALLALAVASAPADARKPRKAKRLTAFASCNQLVEYAGRHVPAAPPTAPTATPRPIFPGREDAPAAPGTPLPATGSPDAGDDGGGDDVSGTNNQEAGRPRARHGEDRREDAVRAERRARSTPST